MSKRSSKASRVEQANEWGVRANEQMKERMAQYSTRRFHRPSTHCATRRRRPNREYPRLVISYQCQAASPHFGTFTVDIVAITGTRVNTLSLPELHLAFPHYFLNFLIQMNLWTGFYFVRFNIFFHSIFFYYLEFIIKWISQKIFVDSWVYCGFREDFKSWYSTSNSQSKKHWDNSGTFLGLFFERDIVGPFISNYPILF